MRMRPVVLSMIVIVLLALAWLPTGGFLPGERTNKPQLYVELTSASMSPRVDDVMFDIRQRIQQRHEWRLVENAAPYAWQLEAEVLESEQLVIVAVLRAPQSETTEQVQEQRFKVQGPYDAMGALPEQFVKVLTDLIENAEKHSTSL
ncbi:hypothetical protein CWI71_06550 [Pseudidiomarina insulisalsae]|uniref:Signaling protein n=2 Tax=Pseudidiomarina insulisalsae TaxID=575789 RepID=A0A432YHU6_9GAMM|nr:hypothetical protein CWI71_06550 [Pseudidiomarina insulisalsae]